VRRLKIWVLLQSAILLYCMLYNDRPDGRTDAVARYESFAQITYINRSSCSLSFILEQLFFSCRQSSFRAHTKMFLGPGAPLMQLR